MQRDLYWDILRGFAMITVVLGHCIVSVFSVNEPVLAAITMYEMPLFVAICGFFFARSVKKYDFRLLVSRKFFQLMIPSLFWGLFNVIMIGSQKILTQKPIEVTYFVDLIFTGMWFLTALFIIECVCAFLYHFCRGYSYIAVCILYCILYVSPQFWMRNELLFLLPFFVGAMALGDVKWISCPWWLAAVALIVFVGCLQIYTFDYSMYRMDSDIYSLSYHKKNAIRLLGGGAGIILSVYLCKWLSMLNRLRWLALIGTITLPIYVLHQKFLMPLRAIEWTVDSYYIYIVAILLSVVITLLSIVFYKLFHRIKLCRILMFGESN